LSPIVYIRILVAFFFKIQHI